MAISIKAINGLLTTLIAGMVMVLGLSGGSNARAFPSSAAVPLKAAALSESKSALVSVDKPLDDSCLRVPVAHPLTK